MVVLNFNKKSFRSMPATAYRISKTFRYVFAENKTVRPSMQVSKHDKMIFAYAYVKPMPADVKTFDTKKNPVDPLRSASVANLINLYNGAIVHNLHAWTMSSSYTVAFAIWNQ